MWYLLLLIAFSIYGCRSKAYSAAYNMHTGTEILMRYDPAAQKLVVMSDQSGSKKFAKLKFSPPHDKLKYFAGKEDNVRACVSKSDLGFSVRRTVDEWVDAIAQEKSDIYTENPPKFLRFKVRSEVDDKHDDIPIEVKLSQEKDRWTIVIRNEKLNKGTHASKYRPLATVILERAGRTDGIAEWKVDINQVISEVMHTRNVLLSCIFSVNR